MEYLETFYEQLENTNGGDLIETSTMVDLVGLESSVAQGVSELVVLVQLPEGGDPKPVMDGSIAASPAGMSASSIREIPDFGALYDG